MRSADQRRTIRTVRVNERSSGTFTGTSNVGQLGWRNMKLNIIAFGKFLPGRAAALLGLTALAATPAAAATNGALGATSTGSVQITVSVPSRVQITGLTDISFANAEPNAQALSAQNNCVWSNTATKGYTITATGSGT